MIDQEPGVPAVVLARPKAPGAHRIERRGVAFGWIAERAPEGAIAPPATLRARWRASLPIVLPGLLRDEARRERALVTRSLDLLDRLREGVDLKDALRRAPYAGRLGESFRLTGSSQDLADVREIQKVHADAVKSGRVVGRDLFIKVNWLSMFPGDGSMRLRFSFGSERLHDWARDRFRSACAAALAERVFPECRLVSRNARVASRLRSIVGKAVHFPERIVYSNSPRGGAIFHHDFVGARQCGVIFSQLAGKTFWLSLPKSRLVEHLAAHVLEHEKGRALRRLAKDPRALGDYLEDPQPKLVTGILDADPRFFRRLVEGGHGRVLRPGDSILLPSASIDAVAWHSVFCLTRDRSLALSFAMRPGPAVDAGF